VDIANNDTVNVIYKCLSSANRSEADKEMSTVATKVLINLAKYENTATSVWQVTQLMLVKWLKKIYFCVPYILESNMHPKLIRTQVLAIS
jgi:hypothetical protein